MSDIQRIGLRHDTEANWVSGNPTLVVDETVIVDDTGLIIRGDGSAFNTSYEEVGVLGAPDMVMGKFIGETFTIPGNYIAPSTGFPAVCLTAFENTSTISSSNYARLVPWLRTQKLIYKEELTGEASTFAGTASGSVVTLSAGTANEDLAAGLAEWFADMAAYPAVVISTVTYEVTDVNATTLAITLGAAPGDGAVTLEVYPHRIAGSTTTARLWSWVGKTAIGAGTTEVLAMMMRRDHGQQVTGSVNGYLGLYTSSGTGALATSNVDLAATGAQVGGQFRTLTIDTANSTAAGGSRVDATTTHSPDAGVHWYMWAGTYSA